MKEITIKLEDDVTYKLFHDTVDELCAKGIAEGCYQDYVALMQVVNCLSQIESSLKENESK